MLSDTTAPRTLPEERPPVLGTGEEYTQGQHQQQQQQQQQQQEEPDEFNSPNEEEDVDDQEQQLPLQQPPQLTQMVTQSHITHAHAVGTDPRNALDARRRLMQDLRRMQANQNDYISASPINGDLFHWRAVVVGPDNTSWEGGLFKLRLDFTEEYPCAPPRVRFITKNVFHPNVYTDGNICLDTLKTHWSPALDVEALLLMVASLLSDPNPASAANGEAAELYTRSRGKYEERVRRVADESLDQSFSEEED
ncbi:ubiquitin-conjugating enzyme e2 [Trypanosoma grayi]|uniref:ubiquitin-conjugating enzyme e2 n=1 Tax=Trypanosoma grayi TaxID=71804 RepID=UPI0004F47F4B|nr:ubiquitin-conjugating enzyme e2 [Trypanosoma grayi]KEG07978.1 ubiquitin-conjugating enzyme e2 [Trypanosoma grayi]